jgi:hypothetical protein
MRIGHLGFDETLPEERIVIVMSITTLFQGLLHMKAQTKAFKLWTAETSRRPLRHFHQTLSCGQRHGRLEEDLTNPRLQPGV